MSSSMTPLDEETRNFFCITLLLYELANKKLRHYFQKQWLSKTKSQWTEQPSDGNRMFSMVTMAKVKLFGEQEKHIKSGNTEEWDITLLTRILLSMFVPKPSPEYDALEELRRIRNAYAHSSNSKIGVSDFQKMWSTACQELKVFGAVEEEFKAIEEKLQNPTEKLIEEIRKIAAKMNSVEKMLTELDRKQDEQHEETLEGLDSIKRKLDEIDGRSYNQKKKQKAIPREIELLRKRFDHFKNEVRYDELLAYLSCLSVIDEENLRKQSKKGNTRALEYLVDLLEEKSKGFQQFVLALREVGLDHIALLLDPDEIVAKEGASSEHGGNEADSFVVIPGTAVDFELTLRIEKDGQRQTELEKNIATKSSYPSSPHARDLRKKLVEHLPKRVHFVKTKQLGAKRQPKNEQEGVESHDMDVDQKTETGNIKNSVVFVFRVTNVKSLDEFWKLYSDGELHKPLKSLLVPENDFKIELHLLDHEYDIIKKELEDIESTRQTGEPAETREQTQTEVSGKDEMEDPVMHGYSSTIPPVYLDDDSDYNMISKNVELREYQKELAQPALEGQNTIICSPTNSGKTYVAMEIAKRHLQDKESDSIEPKVLFIVGTQSLILQQRRRFESYLGGAYDVADISGSNSTEIPLHILLETNHVIVLTAQILVTALKAGNVRISTVSLLIFDECHHTTKDHPFNEIMQRYMTFRHQSSSEMKLPQVVGLTASVGVGKASTPEKALKHLLQLCANLDARRICTVQRNIEELKKYTNAVSMKLIKVEKGGGNIFEETFSKVMKDIEGRVRKVSNIKLPPTDRVSQQYRQWLQDLEKNAVSESIQDLIIYQEQLKRYHQALILNNFVQMKDAMDSLDEFFGKQNREKFMTTEKELSEMFYNAKEKVEERVQVQGQPMNPKLQRLKEILVGMENENNEKKNSEWKGILFSQTRESTFGLKRWINTTEELSKILKPGVLIGGGDAQSGMSRADQENVIKKFKVGEINVLIATTVGEEGLDISDCSYVIRYHMPSNEISSIQSRGRVRAKEGEYWSLVEADSKGAEREKTNSYREMLMASAVEEVQNISPEVYMDQVESIQRKDIEQRRRKYVLSGLASSKRMDFTPGDITFLCRKCKEHACQAHHIRRLRETYHVVIDSTFAERITVKPRKREIIDGITMDKEIRCKKCDEDWGVIAKVEDLPWPCIKIKGFIIEYNGKKSSYPKWKKFPHPIPEASSEEIQQASRAITENLESPSGL